MRTIKLAELKPNGGTVRRLAAAARPEGNVLAVVEGTPGECHSVRWLNLADGREIWRKDLPGGEGVPVPALSPDLQEFAYFERDADGLHLYLERAQTNPVLRRRIADVFEGEEYSERYYAIAIAPDGRFLQASTDGSTHGWDITNALAGLPDEPIGPAFGISEGGADGEFLAIAPSNLSILAHANGDCSAVNEYRNDWAGYVSSKTGGPVRGLTFSPDGRWLCVAEGGAVAVYRTFARLEEDEEAIKPTRSYRLQGHEAATAVAFSPDSNTLATADEQGAIRLWDAATGTERPGSGWDWEIGTVGALAFAPDGFTCVAGGEGGRIVVWDLDVEARPAPSKKDDRPAEEPAEEAAAPEETAAAPPPGSVSLLFWDFENAMSANGVSISVGVPTDPRLVSGFVSQTGGGPAERWRETGMVFLTRRFGAHDPFVWLTVNRPVLLTAVTFRHWHNHNAGFPTERGYRVQLQIDAGESTPYADLGKPLNMKKANSGETATIAVEHQLLPGRGYKLRWHPRGLVRSIDTSSDFFAIKDLRLDAVVVEDEQAAEAPGEKKGRRKAKGAKE